MRREYGSPDRDDLDVGGPADGWPALLQRWLSDAQRAGEAEPNAMVLATVEDGRPVTRSVLCKGVAADGLTFFTNYESDKGRQLQAVPYASVTFPWYRLGRQVHLRGAVDRVDRTETEAYWATRPRGAQLGAWASSQSQPIASREALVQRLSEVGARFGADDPIPAPPHWGGYRIIPEIVEFWRGRPDRLHDRVRAVRTGTGPGGFIWSAQRLQP